MPYLKRTGRELIVDCAARPPGMPKDAELQLFKVELSDGDSVTVVNAETLPVECWADIGYLAQLEGLWQRCGRAAFTCLRPPRLLLLVFQTLGVTFTTVDGGTAAAGSPP